MKRSFTVALLAISFIVSIGCEKKEPRRPGFEDLGPIADAYKAPETNYGKDDLNGTWNTTYNDQEVNVTIDFDAGKYYSDAEGTAPVELRFVSEDKGTVVFKLTSPDGAESETMSCVFLDRDTISMTGATGPSQRFTRVKE